MLYRVTFWIEFTGRFAQAHFSKMFLFNGLVLWVCWLPFLLYQSIKIANQVLKPNVVTRLSLHLCIFIFQCILNESIIEHTCAEPHPVYGDTKSGVLITGFPTSCYCSSSSSHAPLPQVTTKYGEPLSSLCVRTRGLASAPTYAYKYEYDASVVLLTASTIISHGRDVGHCCATVRASG